MTPALDASGYLAGALLALLPFLGVIAVAGAVLWWFHR